MTQAKTQFDQYHFNQKLLLERLEKSGYSITTFDDTQIALVEKKLKKTVKKTVKETQSKKLSSPKEIIFDIHSSANSYAASWICSDKFLTKKWLLSQGLPVVKGAIFQAKFKQKALSYARSLGLPVVLKPVSASHGDYVYANITSLQELSDKIDILTREYTGEYGYFLVEKHFPGEEFRIFVTSKGFFAAVHRQPAQVIGDGKHSLLQLIQISNYQRMNPRTNALCEIKMDDVFFNYLDKHNVSIETVPAKGEVVTLRDTSNVSKGGDCIDVTDTMHASIKKLAFSVLEAFPGMQYLGIDLLCADHTKKLKQGSHVICEVNPNPGLSLHTHPGQGKARDVVGALLELQ